MYASQHDGIVDWSDLSPMPSEGHSSEAQTALEALASRAANNFFLRIVNFIESAKAPMDMTEQDASWQSAREDFPPSPQIHPSQTYVALIETELVPPAVPHVH